MNFLNSALLADATIDVGGHAVHQAGRVQGGDAGDPRRAAVSLSNGEWGMGNGE